MDLDPEEKLSVVVWFPRRLVDVLQDVARLEDRTVSDVVMTLVAREPLERAHRLDRLIAAVEELTRELRKKCL